MWGVCEQRLRAQLAPQVATMRLLMDLRLALTEGMTNAIVHGHREDGRPLRVAMSIDNAEVVFGIEDTGPGFELPASSCLPPNSSPAGRGVYLMTAVVDNVAYDQSAERNVLRLTRVLQPSEDARTGPATS